MVETSSYQLGNTKVDSTVYDSAGKALLYLA